LFDTGSKENVLIANLHNFGLDISSIDAVFLSHNHYDHTNGLSGILRYNEDLPMYVHKYWEKPVRHKGNSIPLKNKIVVKEGRQFKELGGGIYITNAYMSPDYGGIYEHACYIQTKDAYILLCGCCHPGLLSFLNDRQLLEIPVDSTLHIIGGFHGFKFDNKKAELLDPQIRSVTVCHCTKNIKVYQDQFGDKCNLSIVGKKLSFQT